MSKRRRESRDDHYEATSTTHEAVGKHGDEYKSLFESFISSDVSFNNESVHQIIVAIKAFALTQSIEISHFALEMNVRSMTMLLTLASHAESSRVMKAARNTWSISPLARVEPVISKLSYVTSKRHYKELSRKSSEFDSLNVIVQVVESYHPIHHETFDRSLHSSTRLGLMRINRMPKEAAFVAFHSPIKWR